MTARSARRGDTRWTGFLAHVTETCGEGAVNVITDVNITNAVIGKTLSVVLDMLGGRELLPQEHNVNGPPVPHPNRAAGLPRPAGIPRPRSWRDAAHPAG
ncbi:hypothetical protein [Streptomyces sp. NPDC048606]|uniref:hypothetical protein n=1 Tax=Streptomyces sp. NPDC048606 TaxID=3154726 RepID=UPI00341F8B05